MTIPFEVFGLTSEALVWQAILLTFISFVVGLLGGFVGLALGTMRLPALLLMGITELSSECSVVDIPAFGASNKVGGQHDSGICGRSTFGCLRCR